MTDFVIHEEQINGPATHVLIIGVGNYPHLVGGSSDRYSEHGGMRQLSSPPISALAVAEWLVTSYDHPSKPLASVSMLSSAAEPSVFTNPKTATQTPISSATFSNLDAAARSWKGLGDSNPDNLMLFYFCGHGIANGPDLSLLLEDFGSVPDSALEYALDFRRFHIAMERCNARHQCFFIDACRSGDRNIIDAAGYAGRSIFTPSTRRNRDIPIRQKPVFYSTFAGERAQSRTGQVSLFTDAILKAFEGGGADDTDGDWWVDTSQLQKTVQFMMERAIDQGFPSSQANPVDDMSVFQLHRLTSEPSVPVVIGCRPNELNQLASLSWQSGPQQDTRPPQDVDWDTSLIAGRYTFSANVAGGQTTPPPIERTVRPPYRRIKLEVEQ
jgi:hypothetical protein